MRNRFRHCSDQHEATSLLCLYLSSEDEQVEKQAINDEYDAFIFEHEMLEYDGQLDGPDYQPFHSEDEAGYDYHENIHYKDIPDEDNKELQDYLKHYDDLDEA